VNEGRFEVRSNLSLFDDHLNLFEYLESVLYTNDSLLSYVVAINSEIPLDMMIFRPIQCYYRPKCRVVSMIHRK